MAENNSQSLKYKKTGQNWNNSQNLDPSSINLRGKNLIEASAGTGKTWTISTLYLRYILGPWGFEDKINMPFPLKPENILVVTFTDAATNELKDRIRKRLMEASAIFKEGKDRNSALNNSKTDNNKSFADNESSTEKRDIKKPEIDMVLSKIRDYYPPESWEDCAKRLEEAARTMDDAAISTIHSFCLRMLKEHAFDSNNSFNQNIIETAKNDLYLKNAVYDYWRSHYYGLDDDYYSFILDHLKDPDDLMASVKKFLNPSIIKDFLHENNICLEENETRKNKVNPISIIIEEHLINKIDALILQLNDKNYAEIMDYCKDNNKSFHGNKISEKLLNARLGSLKNIEKLKIEYEKVKESIFESNDNEHSGDTSFFNLKNNAIGTIKTNWDKISKLRIGYFESALKSEIALTVLENNPLIKAIENISEEFENNITYNALLAHSVNWISKRFELEKKKDRFLSFDDCLIKLNGALTDEKRGKALANTIKNQFPVLMVDEFQDTDPTQYGIFESIYDIEKLSDRSENAVMLIGDPKQAIYSFRGGDIFTYIKAKKSIYPFHHTLDTNYRSSTNMIEGINRLFEFAEKRENGAFNISDISSESWKDNPIPFERVKARGLNKSFGIIENGKIIPQNAVNFSLYPARKDPLTNKNVFLNSDRYREKMAQIFAAKIDELLKMGKEKKAGFYAKGEDAIKEVLLPIHIAVLVNNKKESNAIKKALKLHGINSVYLSDDESVMGTQQALDLSYIMQACLESNKNQIKKALATGTINLPFKEIRRLDNDGDFLIEKIEKFKNYGKMWEKRGLISAIRQIIFDFNVAKKMMAYSNHGERELTDLLHISEILQNESPKHESPQSLLRYFKSIIGNSDKEDHYKQRLESDKELLRIITIHKSKGLEYPLVFIPFTSSFRSTSSDKWEIYHDPQGNIRIGKAKEGEIKKAVDKETLCEDIRKLYVAFTRAKYGTFIGICNTKELKNSAMAYLLGEDKLIFDEKEDGKKKRSSKEDNDKKEDIFDDIKSRLNALDNDGDKIFHIDEIADFEPEIKEEQHIIESRNNIEISGKATFLAPRKMDTKVQSDWWITSYSSLFQGAYGKEPESSQDKIMMEMDIEENIDDTEDYAFDLTSNKSEKAKDENHVLTTEYRKLDENHLSQEKNELSPFVHNFPGGTKTGLLIHSLFEWAAAEGFENISKGENSILVENFLKKLYRKEEHYQNLIEWFTHILKMQINIGENTAFSFEKLEKYKAELEFLFESERIEIAEIDRICREYLWPQAKRPMLESGHFKGMLKGFIDLIFIHNGKYYILDYKSNRLGNSDQDYSVDSMKNAMLSHRYDLQLALYTLALHRHLGNRIGDYDYERHIGGGIYLFLRGYNAQNKGTVILKPKKEFVEKLDALFKGDDMEL